MIHHGDCIEVMAQMAENSVDAIVTDPPYGLEFMGKSWDRLGDVGTTSHSGPADVAGGERGQYGKVSYGGSANKKCRTCGKWAWDYPERKCVCETPDFPSVVNHQARLMQAWHEAWVREAFRVAKPGAYLLAFGGTRTVHRLACAIEDAGWEIRDELIWVYASGFPKSLDVSKALDKRGGNAHLSEKIAAAIKAARESRGWTTSQADRHFCGGTTNWTWFEGRKGVCRPPTPDDFARIVAEWPELAEWADAVAEAEREVTGESPHSADRTYPRTFTVADEGIEGLPPEGRRYVTAPATDLAKQWEGWGTALKPAHEPIVMARKPLVGSVAANVTRWGVGALNIGATRIGTTDNLNGGAYSPESEAGHIRRWEGGEFVRKPGQYEQPAGRWPSNLLLSDPELFDVANPGVVGSGTNAVSGWRNEDRPDGKSGIADSFGAASVTGEHYGDSGGYSRFFIVPKSARNDREPVLKGGGAEAGARLNAHPT